MQKPPFLMLILLLGATSVHGQHRWEGQIHGTSVSVKIPRDTILKQPLWNPDESQPPLSIHEALEKARDAVFKKHPHFRDLRWTYVFTLAEEQGINDKTYFKAKDGSEWRIREDVFVTGSRWVYNIEFRHVPVVSDGPTVTPPRFPVAVLLDGTVALPDEHIVDVDADTLRKLYDRVLDPK